MPVAIHKARAPAILRPSVLNALRNCIFITLSGYLLALLHNTHYHAEALQFTTLVVILFCKCNQ